MVVVVDVPHAERGYAFVFGGPFAGVEELFGQDPFVALYLAVVSRYAGRDALVT